MNFFVFLLFFIICSLILGLVLLCVYKLYIKKKCLNVSKLAEREIDKYFNAYDYPEDFETWRIKNHADDIDR